MQLALEIGGFNEEKAVQYAIQVGLMGDVIYCPKHFLAY